MAVEVDSPRLSFSLDLSENDVASPPAERYIRSSSTSSIDFDFCVFRGSFDHESSSASADELFSGGVILPIEIKKQLPPARIPASPPPPPPIPDPQKSTDEKQSKSSSSSSSSSFWKFKRSSSLNCGSGYARTLCPIPLLSRSNSTGSAAAKSPKSQNLAKNAKPGSYQKPPPPPPTKKPTSHHHHPSGGRIVNPVINVFTLASIFSGGKDRSSNRKR
ncbi:hypothetical protein M569_05895 [Genlisea aurea]|uniref:Uncharacterized protein n=1 Tax=Genlisea aurea TaxID=192259 RepID=S8DZV9_9LAMI|nr:hypothetical protein M569_05895 [Genlisea aurea]